MKSCCFRIHCVLNRMQANFEQIIQRIVDMGGQNINSSFFSYCAVEFGTKVISAVKTVWLIINIFPLPPF